MTYISHNIFIFAMSNYDVKSRGRSKYRNMHIHKTIRKQEEYYYNILGNDKSMKYIDTPSNLVPQKRQRTESPPPKHKRNRNGFNRGNVNCCSYCRPEIVKRAYKTSVIRYDMRQMNKIKQSHEFEDVYETEYNECCKYSNGYDSE
jgi:hypothetical protein